MNPSIKDSVINRIQNLSKNQTKKQGLIDLFIAHLDHKEVQRVSSQLKLYPLIPSNPSALSKEQLYTLFIYNLSHHDHDYLAEIIEQCLETSPHLFSVLEQAINSVEDKYKRALTKYCFEKALDLIPGITRHYNANPQKKCIVSTIEWFENSYSRPTDYIKDKLHHYANLYNLEASDYTVIYDALNTNNALNYWRLAGHKELMDLISESLIALHPALLERSKTGECMETFFPQLVGKNSNFENMIRFMFVEATLFESRGRHAIWRDQALRHPISDADLMKYYTIITSTEFNSWFADNLPQLNHFHFSYPFYNGFGIDKLNAPFVVLETFQNENSEEDDPYQLLRTLFLKKNLLSEPNSLLSLSQKYKNLSDSALNLKDFFETHPQIFDQNKKLAKRGSIIIPLITSLIHYEDHLAKLDELLVTSTLAESQKKFVRDLFSEVFLSGRKLTWSEVYEIECKYASRHHNFSILKIAISFRNDPFREWLNKINPEICLLIHASLCNFEKSLPHFLIINQLKAEIQNKKWLTRSDITKFLTSLLKFLVRCDDDEQKQESIAQRMRWNKINTEKLDQVKELLKKEEVIALLSTDKLSEARAYLLKNLRCPAASSSNQSNGDCVIS